MSFTRDVVLFQLRVRGPNSGVGAEICGLPDLPLNVGPADDWNRRLHRPARGTRCLLSVVYPICCYTLVLPAPLQLLPPSVLRQPVELASN
ncbi:hypothetical protein L3X38_042262 [Prunus dulcis]|uniref:Uncharacterized protein n=1 Tax=Prunus dulcis TaxID=3755 RepID=A0AAD4YLT5_PRUDU|nr:hypothetical protein L3X38_042262 [Prunus dulcis]